MSTKEASGGEEEHTDAEIGHNAAVNLAIRAEDAGLHTEAQELIEVVAGKTPGDTTAKTEE